MSPEFIAYVRTLLDYDPNTGLFRYKRRRSLTHGRAGDFAGYVDKRGYHRIKITFNGRKIAYSSARLAVAIVTGLDPGHRVISQKNGYRSDLRWKNLVVLSRAQRTLRSATRSTNTSGHTGVYWHSSRKKWEATIKTGSTHRHLGYFDRIEDAVAVRRAAVRQLMPPTIGGPIPAS